MLIGAVETDESIRNPGTIAQQSVRSHRYKSAAHRDKSREWNVSKQKWNLC